MVQRRCMLCCPLQERIITLARNKLGINLEDNTRGFTGWSNVKNLEKKGWVHRDA